MLGLMNVRREQALASSTSATARAMALSGRIGSSGRNRGGLRLQPLVVFGLAAGAVGDLALELAAGGIDVVAARAPYRSDHAGVVEQLLEAADRLIVRALEARARERIERDQVDLGRVLHLHPALEVAHQPQ